MSKGRNDVKRGYGQKGLCKWSLEQIPEPALLSALNTVGEMRLSSFLLIYANVDKCATVNSKGYRELNSDDELHGML